MEATCICGEVLNLEPGEQLVLRRTFDGKDGLYGSMTMDWPVIPGAVGEFGAHEHVSVRPERERVISRSAAG